MMLTFTVIGAPCECVIAELLESCCISTIPESITDNTWVIRVPEWQAVPFVEAAQEAGLVIHANAPHRINSDPTFAIAAQHLETRRAS